MIVVSLGRNSSDEWEAQCDDFDLLGVGRTVTEALADLAEELEGVAEVVGV